MARPESSSVIGRRRPDELPVASLGGSVHLVCFPARGVWGSGVARELAAGVVLAITAAGVRES